MKQIIDVSVKTRKAAFAACRTNMLVIGRFSDAGRPDEIVRALDAKLGGAIGRLVICRHRLGLRRRLLL